jgi:nucleoside-diphosphate-sugar epimerase
VNLGNPEEYSIMELTHMILKLTGSGSKHVFKPLPQDDPTQRKPNISLAKKCLGWEPSVPVEQGLIKTIDYFKQLLDDEK